MEMKDPVTRQPNGHFFVDKYGAYAIAREVIATHLHLRGNALEKYFNEMVPDAWNRYDVNGDGIIEADRVPTFLRLIVGNVEAAYGL